MKLTVKIKLLPTNEQKASLVKTMEVFNEACNYISEVAFTSKYFGQVGLHHLCYREVRERFGLSAQLTVRAIGKVSESYKVERKCQHFFKKHSAVIYDQRILSFRGLDTVSILSVVGRFKIPIVFGSYAKLEQKRIRGMADMIYSKGNLYLCLCIDLPEPPPDRVDDFLGIDLGIKNIATDSDGEIFSGDKVNSLRKRHAKLRAKLQSKGTKSAKRLLKKHSGKEKRFARDANHCISKRLVAKAKDTSRGIALENLKGIRERTTVRKPQRRTHNSWSFYQLRSFIEYKAKLMGIPTTLVDPRNTSRLCPRCGYISKSNRKSQDSFACVECGFSGHADTIAAENIRRAAVNQPNAEAA